MTWQTSTELNSPSLSSFSRMDQTFWRTYCSNVVLLLLLSKTARAVVDIKACFLDPIRRKVIYFIILRCIYFYKFSCVRNKFYLSTRLLSHVCLPFVHNKVWSSSWQSHFVKYTAYNPYVTIQQVACLFYLLLYCMLIQEAVWNKVPISLFLLIKKILLRKINTGSGRNTWRFGNAAVSGTVGVGNLSLRALLAKLKAFQLPWSAGL